MIGNNPIRPTVRVIEVCHDPLSRRFDFPGVRNINRLRIANGTELKHELALNTGRFDRPEPDDRQAFLDLGVDLVRQLPVVRFQFDFTPAQVVKNYAGEPFIGPRALAAATGISRNQVYLAIEVGAIDTFVSHWRGIPISYIIVNDRLAHWMWGQHCGEIAVTDYRFPVDHSRESPPDLFGPGRSDTTDLIEAVRLGIVPGKTPDAANPLSTVVRGSYQFVLWLAQRRTDESIKRITDG